MLLKSLYGKSRIEYINSIQAEGLAMFNRFFRSTVVILIIIGGTVSVTAQDSLFSVPPVQYPTGDRPVKLFSADLDNDSDIDLALARNTSENEITVLLNNGDGTYAAAVDYDAGDPAAGIYGGDLDGDDDVDLVVAKYSTDNFAVLFNNGNGTFTSPVSYDCGDGPYDVFMADLDGDLDNDLVIVNWTGSSIQIFNNDGSGVLSLIGTYSAATWPRAVFVTDLDGDNDQDLAVACYTEVGVLLNDGSAGFTGPVNYATGSSCNAVYAAYLNSDSYPDLAAVNQNSNNVSVLMNNGNGTFAAAANYATGTGPSGIWAADFSGDGYVDLATANAASNNISILVNDGSGLFSAPENYDGGTDPVCLTAADVDGDCDYDLATANEDVDSVSVLYNLSGCAGDARFVQWDWYDGNYVLMEENSLWGVVYYTYMPDTFDIDYMNLKIRHKDGSMVWVIQNNPLLPVLDPAPLKNSVCFDISELGYSAGEEIPEVEYVLTYTEDMIFTMPDVPVNTLPVYSEIYFSWDSFPTRSGRDVSISPPTPIRLTTVPTILTPTRRNVPGVEEHDRHCTAGAYARSMAWLNSTYNFGWDMSGQDHYNNLRNLGVSDPESGGRTEWLRLKDLYARAITDDAIYTKVYDPDDFVGPIDGISETVPPGLTQLAWLINEAKTEDVEVAYRWTDSTGASHYHIVTLCGLYRDAEGRYVIGFRDDSHQGDNTQGDDGIKWWYLFPRGDGSYDIGVEGWEITWMASESVKTKTWAGNTAGRRAKYVLTLHQGSWGINEQPADDVHLVINTTGNDTLTGYHAEINGFSQSSSSFENNHRRVRLEAESGYAPYCSRIKVSLNLWTTAQPRSRISCTTTWTRHPDQKNFRAVDSVRAAPDFGFYLFDPMKVSPGIYRYWIQFSNNELTDSFELVDIALYPSDTAIDSIEYVDASLFPMQLGDISLIPGEKYLYENDDVLKDYLYGHFLMVYQNDTTLEDWFEFPLEPVDYLCGNPNGDGTFNILDITYLIAYLYKGGPPPDPMESGDANADGVINILDVTYLINYLYKDGPPPLCP